MSVILILYQWVQQVFLIYALLCTRLFVPLRLCCLGTFFRLQAALLGADKPNGAKAHSSGELKLSSSQVALSYCATVATDAPFASALRKKSKLLGFISLAYSYLYDYVV